ncbi:hypothetical protein B0H13DRAFT_2054959 [Mycena leptocephala]|nr:hypothetical protein B0H13DRAFT_2127153 [Mycena leptocephala]KAJ7876605.1 hypothetical protein B0H13DRAFT_2054959 [Mycena leptocephala]
MAHKGHRKTDIMDWNAQPTILNYISLAATFEKRRLNQHKQDQRESLGRTKDGGCTKRHSTETPNLAPYCAPIFQLSVAQTCREVYQSWIRYKWPPTEGNLPENHRTMEWLLDARNPVKVDWRAENIREEFVGVALTRWRGVGASGGGGKNKRGGVLSEHETPE